MEKKILIKRIILTLIYVLVSYYLFLPVLNLTSPDFWTYIVSVYLIYLLTGSLKLLNWNTMPHSIRHMPKKLGISFLSIFGIVALILVINIIFSPVFSANSYANRITVDDSTSFTEDVDPVKWNNIPLLDKNSSQKLGDRVMGQMPELVSQFAVSDLYTQINYNNDIVRVTPLEYADWIKFFSNKKEGVKGYITVNSVSGESNLVKLDEGMQYMPSALFNKNLYRHLRFSYPTEIFGSANFEIDNEGNPYWIVPTIKYTGVGLKEEISGVIILNPINGESNKYNIGDVPSWVDHVYPANLIIEQVNDWGKYQNGFFNSIFGQKGVIQTTTGYNYTVMNDDVYLYTGITSASSDESNLGFILTNMRTKETNFYSAPGAEEYSAMASAEGQVQQMSYVASFPLLINLNNRPTYLISLKDNAGLVKMYSFVDVADYQKVVVTDVAEGIEKASVNYINNANLEINKDEVITKPITISTLNMAIIDGNTYYFLTDTAGNKYRLPIKVDTNLVPFLKVGQTINISYATVKDVIEIIKIEK